jgi:hypothetical protein
MDNNVGGLKDFLDRKKDLIRVVTSVIFWGSLWGLVEATIGYILHLVRLQGYRGVTSFFLFPMACYYMNQVRRETAKREPIIYMAVLAACIKLLDFFIPGHDSIRIIYPAIAIILEGMAVYGAFVLAGKRGKEFGYPEALFASLSWRVVFTAIQFTTLPQTGLPTLQSVMKFILVDGPVNSLIIYLYVRFIKRREKAKKGIIRRINPIAAVVTLVLSILSKWVI